MRVIAGSAGGLRLVAPKGARPTTDRVKESLFASLGAAVDDANVLDLFAGSGALGIEALSRGARRATFVDDDRDAMSAIRANLESTGFADRATVVGRPAGRVVRAHRERGAREPGAPRESADLGAPFDLVLLDPPYDIGAQVLGDLLAAIDAGGWVAPGATIVVERRTGSEPVTLPPRWQVARERTYGDTLTLVLTVPSF